MTHPNPQRHVVPTAVLTRFRIVPLSTARPVNTTVPQNKEHHQRPVPHGVHKPHSPKRRHINRRPSPPASNFHHKVTTAKASQVNVVKGVKGNWGNPHHALMDKGVIDSGCSRHITGNMSYLSDFEEINGRYVSFGGNPKGGKITGKGKIKTDTKCIVLSSDFKPPDENHVLLRVPRENNMYNVDPKNIVSSGDLTCLFPKKTLNESNLWHKRLGHINFKTLYKLVKGDLARVLSSKVFENNHTCVACKKGKKHRASCKSKPVSSTSNNLHNAIMEAGGKDRPPMLAPDKTFPVTEGSSETTTKRFVTLVKQSQVLKTVSYHKLYDILKQHQNEVNEIRAERLARTANPLVLVAQQQPVYHTQNHPTHYTQNSSTRSKQAATKNKGKAIVNSPPLIYDQEPSMVAEDDEMHVARECQKPKQAKDAGYRKEKMLLCKQEEARFELNAEQADWRDDTDDELKDQELEAHYMYLAQIQEVTPDAANNSGPIFDIEPL
nr:hypothetical protein [Tanacetum cinerariifolium]